MIDLLTLDHIFSYQFPSRDSLGYRPSSVAQMLVTKGFDERW
jgi:hypothetical protein